MPPRAEQIERDRSAIAELGSKYGLTLRGSNGENFLEQAAALKLPRKVLSPPKTVIPCAAELKDLGKADPCLIVPSNLPIELLPQHKSIAVGGQILTISRSPFALSNYLMDEAWRAQGYWNGQPRPMLVAIAGDYHYLVKQKSYFFRHGKYRGSDVDQVSPKEPEDRDLKLNRFQWGSDLGEELTVIVAEY